MENIVYTTDYCPFCFRVKRALEAAGVEFEEKLLVSREDINEVKEKYGWRTVPIVVLDGKFVGGCMETEEFIAKGQLSETPGGAG